MDGVISFRCSHLRQSRDKMVSTSVSFPPFLTGDFVYLMEDTVDSEWYKRVLSFRFAIGSILSVECAIANLVLIISTLSDENTRTWQIFPVVMQALVDFVGPGVANVASEVYAYRVVMFETRNIYI